MLAMILIILMVVAVVTTELIMRCAPEADEGVESPAEIAGD